MRLVEYASMDDLTEMDALRKKDQNKMRKEPAPNSLNRESALNFHLSMSGLIKTE